MVAGASAVLVVMGAGVAGVTTVVGGGGGAEPGPRIVTEVNQAAPVVPLPVRQRRAHEPLSMPKNRAKVEGEPHRAVPPKSVATDVTPSPIAAVITSQVQIPQTRTQTQTETREIPYETRLVHDPALPRGAKRVETPGINGVETLRYLVTLTDGRPTDRKLIDAVVTRQPQHQVVALGTRRPVHNCGEALNFCVPLGRKAVCPDKGREEDATIPLPDLAPNTDDLGYLQGLAC
jgi:hypothetical protein